MHARHELLCECIGGGAGSRAAFQGAATCAARRGPPPPPLTPHPSAGLFLQTSSTIAANQYQGAGGQGSFKLDAFKQGLNIEVTRYEAHDMEFEVKGISCAVSGGLGA